MGATFFLMLALPGLLVGLVLLIGGVVWLRRNRRRLAKSILLPVISIVIGAILCLPVFLLVMAYLIS